MTNSKLSYNRLKNEKSLYLKQHQDNPIHWWPYGPEALALAKSENKPIFLSIGYSSCHWCHVMSHESFSDEKVAEFLNTNFVNIKVDKEEFPDIDSYYQKAAQMFNNNGGWPLSAFLLPDLRPFFVGTYFPLNSKNETPGFLGLINELSNAYNNSPEIVLSNATQVYETINKKNPLTEKVEFPNHFPPPAGILEALKEFKDEQWGGFGEAPKFPHYSFYEWAMEQMLEGMIPKEHGEFIIKSFEKMLLGGINDHARGGIHRYSTDKKWLVPHFEKMLYDQAGLLKVLAKMGLLYPAPIVFDTLINTLDYLEQEMLSDDLYFFSSQDADSEGVEGLFFTFTESEFEDLLNKNDDSEETLQKNMEQIKKWFQIQKNGNFEHQLNIISLNPEFKDEIYQQNNWDIVRKVRKAILNERRERMPPTTDTKGVASWNFMLISALTDVIQYCQIDIIKRMASTLLNKVLEGIYKTFLITDHNGMKLRHSTSMEYSHPYLEDFVTFAESQLRLYEVSGNPVFKQNFLDSMQFIAKEFLENDHMLTRARFANDFELYPNQEFNMFDNSFKSQVSTFIILSKRAAVLFGERDFLDMIGPLNERVTHTILKLNPISAGEALRGLTYPDEVYRVLKIPRNWTQEDLYLKMTPYFLTRFVLDYHDNGEEWEICNLSACEMKGVGLAEFVKILTPNQEE